jgi:hypothetical protein
MLRKFPKKAEHLYQDHYRAARGSSRKSKVPGGRVKEAKCNLVLNFGFG